MVYLISKRIFWPILSLFIKKIDGLENLPDKPFILAATHNSYIDAIMLMMMVAWHENKQLCFFATKDPPFTGWLWDALFKHYGAIRVNGSLKKGAKKLKEGKPMGIFPTGRRSPDGKIVTPEHTGLGILALKTGAPIIPVHMATYRFWNTHMLLPSLKRNIKITIGTPKHYKGKATTARAKKIASAWAKEVKKLARISYT